VYLEDLDRRVGEVLLRGKETSVAASAERELDDASAPFGAPLVSRRGVGTDGTFADETRTWKDGGLTLTITLHESIHGADHTFIVFERWALAER
jgi:hypothetical protein